MWQSRRVDSSLVTGILAVVFGLILGSFLNVCIIRIPAGRSIVRPASACPKCGAAIRPYDNIPVVSYLLLGGKCRGCKTVISRMYPTVELLTAALFWGCYRVYGPTPEAVKWAVFSAVMVVLVFTDLRERILPDVVNYPGLAAGLGFSLLIPTGDGTAGWLANRFFAHAPGPAAISLADAVLGAVLGGGLLWTVSKVYFLLRKREGMGMGDVKMMLMTGAFFGVKRTLLTIFAGSLLGSTLGVVFILVRRKESNYELPFGTFLGLAAMLAVFFGTPVVSWYQSLLLAR